MPAKHHHPKATAAAPSPRGPDKSSAGKTLGLLVMYGYTLGGIVLPIILLLPRTMFHDGPSPLWAVPYFILWSVPLHLLKRLDPKGSSFRQACQDFVDKPSRPALADMSLTQRRANIRILFSVALAAFLIGAATIATMEYAVWWEKQARPGGLCPPGPPTKG